MAAHAAGDDIFVYTGGLAPLHVVNAIIDESVEEIDEDAFYNNPNLKSVVCHGGLLKVGQFAFYSCRSLQRVKIPGVKVKEEAAFGNCNNLTHVELDKLETVGEVAFRHCPSPQRVNLPKLKIIGQGAFMNSGVHDAELGEDLETIGGDAFYGSKLRRIAIPLKDGMFHLSESLGTYTQFHSCPNLATVDLVGGIHKTVASLHLQSRRTEMNEAIQRINQILPGTAHDEKSSEIVRWIQSVIIRVYHYKAEHRAIVREAMVLLELALWKAKLHDVKVEGEKCSAGGKTAKKAKNDDDEGARKEARITSGADIIIQNVLSYLKME